MNKNRFDLTDNWKFNIGNENPDLFKLNNWLPAEAPGTIHTDLLINKLIDDPFYDDNELKLSWISRSDWIYKTAFDKPAGIANSLPVFLIFEGIDTIAEILLNGSLLGSSDNMFLKYEFEVTSLLRENNNELEVRFYSPVKYTGAMETKYGIHSITHAPERVYIRKAQYSFGWDWGPIFPTMGIWRPVYLLQRDKNFIKHISHITKEADEEKALIDIQIYFEAEPSENSKIKISLINEEGNIEKEISTNTEKDYRTNLEIINPKLWWPSGEGEQNLYSLKVNLLDDKENVIDSLEKRIGIRTVSLQLKENNETKSTFRLIINGKPIFAKGVNWIPADSFIPRVKPDKYKTLLQYAKQANMNIVRVWGGGFYENDIFYDLCDELGLLVWQDFMFACSSYPEFDEFLNNVKEEVRQNVEKLQNHPSLILWCGNNENEWIWHQRIKTSYSEMPGYKIYHELIPDILKEIDPGRPYWPSSPFSFEEDPNSHLSGNRHEWEIWSRWIDYTTVKNDNSLFVTEFGFQAPANKKTFEKYLFEDNREIQNSIFEFHNKQIEGPERVFRYLAGHLPVKTEWDDFIYLTQLNQAFALKTCLEHWRLNWPVTNGSIIWQINDCWPVTSWALIDSELTPKMAYYFVKNIFNQEIVGFKNEGNDLKVIALNQKKNESEFKLNLQVFSDKTGELIFEEKIKNLISPWEKKELYQLNSKNFQADINSVIVATLLDSDDNILFRNFYTEQRWKYKNLVSPKIDIETTGDESIIVKTDKPAFFVDLFHPEMEFSDKGFIILPGEKKKLTFTGNYENIDEIKIFTLNNYL